MRHAALATLCAAFSGAVAWADCAPDRLEIKTAQASARFTVEIADDPDERALGLMNRDRLADDHGMLFVYERPQTVAFWMKNTRIPLDMIFARADGTVATVHEMAVPFDETAIPGGSDIQFVLEIGGGKARALGIGPGSVLRHPAIDSDRAAWPCSAP